MTNIILYENKSEPNRLDKTPYLVKFRELVGTFRAETSIIKPSILIQISDDIHLDASFNIVTSEDDNVVDVSLINIITKEEKTILATKINYVYIEEFDRYYFVEDMIVVRNDLYQLNLRVDVLMSFKNDILDLSALVLRNENDYNLEIDDPMCRFESNVNTEITTIANDLFSDNEDNQYVVTTVGW